MAKGTSELKLSLLMLAGILWWRKAWTLQTRVYCYWWDITPSGNLSFVRMILVGWDLNPEVVGIALAHGSLFGAEIKGFGR